MNFTHKRYQFHGNTYKHIKQKDIFSRKTRKRFQWVAELMPDSLFLLRQSI